VWHRRAGKDDVALHWAAVAAHLRAGTYWHMLPEASQARKAVWEAVNPHTGKRRIDEAFPDELREATRENEMFIRFKCGSTWQVIGSDNYNSLVGSPPIGIVFSEWALAKPQSWAYLRPIIAENGGWAAFITTPRGNNHAARMYESLRTDERAFVQKLSARETSVFSPEQLDAELKAYLAEYGPSAGQAMFEQEYLCSFDAAVYGAIYPKELRRSREANRIRSVPYVPEKLVYTAWDIGWGDSTSIWFYQLIAGEVRIIDYYESSNEPITHYLERLRAKDYKYDTCWLPHDADNGQLATGKSIAEMVRSNGFRVQITPKLSLEDGINAARLLFPRCFFDEERCRAGLDALQNYRWDENKRLGELKPTPLHDWSSHGADAFRYLAVSLKEVAAKQKPIRYSNAGIV
jgi:phage terminase large subunit